MNPPADLDALIAAAEATADVAAAVVRPFFRSGLGADQKTDRSPVTIADRSAEQAMRAVLAERFPEHGILGEEFGLDRPGAKLRWVLDPVDGTRAFITGRPTFGTLVGLLDGDRPIVGIIDQPVTRERWIGAAGHRTIFRGPLGGRAGCRPCPALAQAELSCTSPEMLGAAEPRWRRLAGAVRRNYWGGDCYAYGLLALGQIDIVAECDMKIWDWTALVPVVEGAGGRVTDWSGNPLRPDGDGSVLSVGDPALLPLAVERLSELVICASSGRPSGWPHPAIPRSVVRFFAVLFLLLATMVSARADDGPVTRTYAIAVLSKPALPANFPYFPYVNPHAPKGGEVTLAAIGAFDSFNPFILRGTAVAGMVGPWVAMPGGSGGGSTVGHVWESLLTSSANEAETAYGHLAQTIEIPADRMWVAFDLRPQAKFSDGTPVTAEDVAWTFRTLLTQGRPSIRVQFADVKDVEVTGPRRVVFHFKARAGPRTAADAGRLAGAAGALVQGPRFLAAAAATRRSAPARIASPASRWAAASPMSAIRTGGRRICPPASAPTTSTRCASSISAIRPWRCRRSRPARSICGRRTSPRTGPPPTTFPR